MGVKLKTVLKKLKAEGMELKEQDILDFDTIALLVPEIWF